ncbi:MAG: hypothetical protein IPJ65_42170 [Archangiaceae bacterium]|nr:hypothetical protein [Archangiaceae bacterium]
MFCLPYRLAPAEQRTSYLALFAASAGLCNGLAAMTAGAVTSALPREVMVGQNPVFALQLLFVFGFGLRLAAVLYALRVVEHGSHGTRVLLAQLRDDALTKARAAVRPLGRPLRWARALARP